MTQSDKIRLVIADDHTLFRDGMRELLVALGFDVVSEAPDGHSVLPEIAAHKPDVVLLDVQMPGPGPAALLDRICQDFPGTRVIFLSMYSPPSLVHEMESRGAAAYLRKTVDRGVLDTTIRAAALGMSLRQESAVQHASKLSRLSKKEIQVLHLVARSYSNQQIATELYISLSTVKRHISSIYTKLEASSRVEALSLAMREGFITGLE